MASTESLGRHLRTRPLSGLILHLVTETSMEPDEALAKVCSSDGAPPPLGDERGGP